MRKILAAILLLALVTACVPQNQYDALVTERNYYRNQASTADSLAELRSINTYNSAGQADNELDMRIRQVEALTATNLALNESYQDLQSRYQQLLGQNQELLSTTGNEVSSLQQSLAERSAEISRREAQLRQIELDLQAREQQISSLASAYEPAGGGAASPQSYGTVSATTPLNPNQNAALTINGIQNEVNQIMAVLPPQSYLVAPIGSNRLQIVFREDLLYNDGYTVSLQGQQTLRRLAATLRNYPSAEFSIVGHADGSQENALRAYEDSTDKAINVASQLVQFGLSPSKVTAGGKGLYAPVSSDKTAQGLASNRRTELIITIPQ